MCDLAKEMLLYVVMMRQNVLRFNLLNNVNYLITVLTFDVLITRVLLKCVHVAYAYVLFEVLSNRAHIILCVNLNWPVCAIMPFKEYVW